MSVEREVQITSYFIKFKNGKYLENINEGTGNTIISFCTNKDWAERIKKDDVKIVIDILKRNGFNDMKVYRYETVVEKRTELVDLDDI